MKASLSPAVVGLATLFLFTAASTAQDILILTNGQRREATVLGVSGDRVRFKAGPVESTLPLSQISEVTMNPPKAFNDALAAWSTGDSARTLSLLKPLVVNFRGLPSAWARRASALLGEVLIANGDIAGAESAFADFQKAYPDASGLSEIGLARLALEKKDFDSAKAKVAPLFEEARKSLVAGSAQNAQFAQALYIMAAVQESEGQLPEALENYLLVVTVFHADDALAARAGERARALAEKNVVVP